MITLPESGTALWLTEHDTPEPQKLTPIGDNTKAGAAANAIRQGETLLWTGDWPNGRHFFKALKKRLATERNPKSAKTLTEHWHLNRQKTAKLAGELAHLVVLIEPDGSLNLPRAQDTRLAVEHAWGLSPQPRVVSLGALLGALGAEEWTNKGMKVPGLEGELTPHYGVFSPTRHAYLSLLDHIAPKDQQILDVGCGTGILGFILLQRGAQAVLATDIDPRAVACAQHNAKQLKLEDRFSVQASDLWPQVSPPAADAPDGDPKPKRWNIVVYNGPWIPEAPKNRLDRAVFDDESGTLIRWLTELPAHLTAGGRGYLIVSDLPERLGLRNKGWLKNEISRASLEVVTRREVEASHRRAQNPHDPLHQARSEEKVVMWELKAVSPT